MTAGYDPSNRAAHEESAPRRDRAGQHAGRDADYDADHEAAHVAAARQTDRRGPLPPRITSPPAPPAPEPASPWPVPSWPATDGRASHRPLSAGPPGPVTAALPAVPAYPPPVQPPPAPPVAPSQVHGGYHTAALPTGPISGGPGYAGPPPGSQPGFQAGFQAGSPHGPGSGPGVAGSHRRGGRVGTVAFALAVLLLLVAGVQSFLLFRLNHALDQANKSAAAERRNAAARAEALDSRLNELEKRAGNSFDAQAVAAEVLPSVFRVVAGELAGTAFAIGKEADGGGTNLLTNFHVVETVYSGGGRDVALERTNARYRAKIVRVDERNDLALLHSAEKFPKLVAEAEESKPGQPVILVGAPLGLDDTVTTGAVSAVRDTPSGRLLQFDAPINPGNSGGPVVNAQRKVVGVALGKIRSSEGLGLAIPIGVACQAFGVC